MTKDNITIASAACTVYADPSPQLLLLQPADRGELELLDQELGHIRSMTDRPFAFAAFEITDWNTQLSPWTAPPVFGNEPFGSGAAETLSFLETALVPELFRRFSLSKDTPVILGGYSLAGLFALWAAYSSDSFAAAAGASPSVWFPGWLDFISGRAPAVGRVYLSLGKKEEKARNKTMAAVGENIRRQYAELASNNIPSVLEWNEGNHFTEPELRTARGFAWCIDQTAGEGLSHKKARSTEALIKKLETEEEIDRALKLVWRVFQQYEAPDYTPEGTQEFYNSITDESWVARLAVYGAFVNEELVGVIATRNEGKHIALFFVDGSFHRQGIGRQLFQTVRTDGMTVNSSPFAVEVYHRLGFKDTDKEQTVNGLRFTPMKLKNRTQ